MGAFEMMGALDAQHRAEWGYDPARLLTGRAAVLADALIPMSRVKPVLRSRYLVKGWLDRGAMSVVYGESNVGKTFFALDMAAHVAAGLDWHGNRVAAGAKWAGPVLYVASEGGIGIRNRLEAMRRENPKLDGDKLMLLPAGLDLCTSEDSQFLVEMILTKMQRKPSLIVVDTLARSMGNGDENTAKDMGQFIRSIDNLREQTGAHVMVIHHSGKDSSKGARGSGSLRAAADTEIELTRDGDVILAEQRKQRDMSCEGLFAYRLKPVFLGTDDDGDNVSSAVVEVADVERTDKRKKLSGRAAVALEALKETIREKGRFIKSPDLPTVPVVELSAWQDACDRVGLTDSDKADTKARTFRRHRDTLMDKDRIRIWDNYVWLADKADRQRTGRQNPDNSTCPRRETAAPAALSGDSDGQPADAEHPQQNKAADNADNLRTPADMSARDPDGHGHPPIRGVPCPPGDRVRATIHQFPANEPSQATFAPMADPAAFDPEMWR